MAFAAVQTQPQLRLIDTRALETFAAPPGRDPVETVRQQYKIFDKDPVYRQLIDFMPNMVLILNSKRQVVFANKVVLDRYGDEQSVIGARFGEIVSCINSKKMKAGCGTSKNCRNCGALKAVLQGIEGKQVEEEHRLTFRVGGQIESKEYRVSASPLEREGQHFLFYVFTDIEDEKRRQVMERVFLHDVQNTAVALRGYSELNCTEGLDEETVKDFNNRISGLADQIVNEIGWQGDLLAAERNELLIKFAPVNTLDVLGSLVKSYSRRDFKEISIVLDDSILDTPLVTDETILSRVLGNILKNALEASVAGQVVTVGCREEAGGVCFWVNNPAYLSENVRLQIFNRSYSTKGKGRGIGTYSTKYLTEKYLGGGVRMKSDQTLGTTFSIHLPV